MLQTFRSTCDFECLEEIGSPWENAAHLNERVLPSIFLDLLVAARSDNDLQKFCGLIHKWRTCEKLDTEMADTREVRP